MAPEGWRSRCNVSGVSRLGEKGLFFLGNSRNREEERREEKALENTANDETTHRNQAEGTRVHAHNTETPGTIINNVAGCCLYGVVEHSGTDETIFTSQRR